MCWKFNVVEPKYIYLIYTYKILYFTLYLNLKLITQYEFIYPWMVLMQCSLNNSQEYCVQFKINIIHLGNFPQKKSSEIMKKIINPTEK
jgi:hypothetical protein